jgi:probable HAF family extracellular repeat protein
MHVGFALGPAFRFESFTASHLPPGLKIGAFPISPAGPDCRPENYAEELIYGIPTQAGVFNNVVITAYRFGTSVSTTYTITIAAAPAAHAAASTIDKVDPPAGHHHYKLIDMGTFGGPMSSLPILNQHSAIAGWSATSTPVSAASNPFNCGGVDGSIPYVTVAFQFENNVLKDLGALPGAKNCSIPFWLNDLGETVGASEDGEVDPYAGVNGQRAVLWKNGQIHDLGSLGGHQNAALFSNNQSQIVGISQNKTADPYSLYEYLLGLRVNGAGGGTQTRAVLWEAGKIRDLGTLGGSDAWASFINESGQISGFAYTNDTPNPSTGLPTMDPFLWQNGKMIDLGSFGGVFGFPNGINSHGQVIGGSSVASNPGACNFENTNPGCDPFLWDHGELIDLSTTSAGGSPQSAFWINDAGEIVGGGTFPSAIFDAYLWRKGVATDLGKLQGDCFSEAYAINAQSQVIGDSYDCDGNKHHPFLWENGSIVDLNTLISANSSLQLVAVGPLSYSLAPLNDRGEIAGVGVPRGIAPGDVDTRSHAFLLIPCDENHPNFKGCDYTLVEATAETQSPAAQTAVSPKAGALAKTRALMNRYHRFGPRL